MYSKNGVRRKWSVTLTLLSLLFSQAVAQHFPLLPCSRSYRLPTLPQPPHSESELLYDWRFTAHQFALARSPLRFTTINFIFQLNTYGYSPYVASSLTRGRVCLLQLLLFIASAVILSSESRGTHDHILLSQIRDSPSWRVRSPIISPRNRMGPIILTSAGYPFDPFLRLIGLGLKYSTPPHCSKSSLYKISARTE
jgi:hypothetical protein